MQAYSNVTVLSTSNGFLAYSTGISESQTGVRKCCLTRGVRGLTLMTSVRLFDILTSSSDKCFDVNFVDRSRSVYFLATNEAIQEKLIK